MPNAIAFYFTTNYTEKLWHVASSGCFIGRAYEEIGGCWAHTSFAFRTSCVFRKFDTRKNVVCAANFSTSIWKPQDEDKAKVFFQAGLQCPLSLISEAVCGQFWASLSVIRVIDKKVGLQRVRDTHGTLVSRKFGHFVNFQLFCACSEQSSRVSSLGFAWRQIVHFCVFVTDQRKSNGQKQSFVFCVRNMSYMSWICGSGWAA